MTLQEPTIENFKLWVKTIAPNRVFKWTDVYACPFASFMQEFCGATRACVGPNSYWINDGLETKEIPEKINRVIEKAKWGRWYQFYSTKITTKRLQWAITKI